MAASPDADAHEGARRGSYRAGFLFGSLSFVVAAGIAMVSTVVTARLYGIRVIGEFALVSVPVAVLWVLSSVKEQQALIREIAGLTPRHPRVTQLFAVVFTFSGALTMTVATLVGVTCLLVFPGPLHAPGLVAAALANVAGYAIVTNTGWNLDSILAAFVAGRQIFWVRLHETLSFIVIAVAVGLVWRSVWGLVIATVGASLTALVHRLIVVRPFVRARLSRAEYRAGFEVLPELLRFGLRATPGQIAQGISQQAGVWALGTVAPIAVVGAYSRAQSVPQRLQQASMRVTEVLYPTLVGRRAKGDVHGFDRALIDSIRYETVGMLLIAAAIGGAAHSVLDVFGPGFSRATSVLALLILFPAMASVTVTQTQALWAASRPGRASVIAIARLIVTVGLLIALTPRLGLVGPAIALLAGYAMVIALNGLALRAHLARPLRATWPLRERAALLLAYALGFLGAHLTERAFPNLAELPLSLLAGACAYAVAFILGGGVNARDRRRVEQALGQVRARRARRMAPAQQIPAADTSRGG
jgi:O-antigen/teichoic acid export membrane protein